MCSRFFGLCYRLLHNVFPSVVLGTINAVMSPIVQGTASMLEGKPSICKSTVKKKDLLEYEQMMNDPSTAYLVDDAEFDRQIDELGVTEIGTAAGMYIERGMYKVKKAIQNFFRELLEMLFQAASLTIDTIRTFFLIVLAIPTDSVCPLGMGRLPVNTDHVDPAIYSDLSMASGRGFVQYNSCQNPSFDASKRHFRTD